MSLYLDIKNKVDTFYAELTQSNPFFLAVAAGTLKPEQLQVFLGNITYAMSNSLEAVQVASDVAYRQGKADLGEYYQRKYEEECGHINWAKSDHAKVQAITNAPGVEEPDQTIVEIAEWYYNEINKDAATFLAYIVFAEYLTVVLGPGLVEGLEKKCHIPADHMTNIATHAELDREHVHEWQEELKRLVNEADYHETFLKHIDFYLQQYAKFCINVMDVELYSAA